MKTYDLPLPSPEPPAAFPHAEHPHTPSPPEDFLIQSARSFCRMRWVVVAALLTYGLAGLLFPGLFAAIGLRPRVRWPIVVAGALSAANFLIQTHLHTLTSSIPGYAKRNLWCQIALDLLVLTVVVHLVGSLETPIAFAYLFHIVLACIFLPATESLLAAGLAGILFILCVWSEHVGLISAGGVLADSTVRSRMLQTPRFVPLTVVSIVAIWFVVWYLASHLAAMVHARDEQLTEANRCLELAQQEKVRHMVRTTHELKAPFAAIHANAELLRKGYCGELPPQAYEIVERISERSRRLATEIHDMLHLVRLRDTPQDALDWETVDVPALLQFCIRQIQPVAEEHGVVLESDLQPASTPAVKEQVALLFTNVLSNAVVYSFRGGVVHVACSAASEGGAVVSIQNEGIGIEPDKLPHIFDEYYRTDEAARHCRESTGLGLAIVRRVAEIHRIQVHVQSRPSGETLFRLRFPAQDPPRWNGRCPDEPRTCAKTG